MRDQNPPADHADDSPRQNAPTTRGRPFPPGNPGRPQGSRNRASVLLDRIADDEAGEVLRVVLDAAKGGDLRAAEIILGRTWPPRRGRPIQLTLPTVTTAGEVLEALGAVIDATAKGEVTPDEAATVAAILETKRKAIETVDIERRVAALEQAKG